MHEMRPSDDLLAEALQLPDEERARLALRLAQSLDRAGGRDSEEAWAREVARRIERLREGTAKTLSGEDALAQARARLSRRA
jgi:putative addiction module component (TIGR02574 family)